MPNHTHLLCLFFLLTLVNTSGNSIQREQMINECGPFNIISTEKYVGNFTNCDKIPNKKIVKCGTLECPLFKTETDETTHTGKTFKFECRGGEWTRIDSLKVSCKSAAEIVNRDVVQNFTTTVIDDVNDLIQHLFQNSYFYLGMVLFYERADVALPGFKKYMSDLSQADQKLALDLMNYIIQRGGYVTLNDIPRPISNELLLRKDTEKAGLDGVKMARDKNREIIERVTELVKIAQDEGDPHMKHVLEDGILSEKIEVVKKLVDLEQRLKTFSDEDYPVGEYVVDREQLA